MWLAKQDGFETLNRCSRNPSSSGASCGRSTRFSPTSLSNARAQAPQKETFIESVLWGVQRRTAAESGNLSWETASALLPVPPHRRRRAGLRAAAGAEKVICFEEDSPLCSLADAQAALPRRLYAILRPARHQRLRLCFSDDHNGGFRHRLFPQHKAKTATAVTPVALKFLPGPDALAQELEGHGA